MPGTVPYPIPNKQTAIVFDNNKKLVVRHDVDVITLDNEPDAVIIKVAAVALNPVDAKMSGDFVTPGAIMGFDLAGTVVAVGPEVKQDLKIGDRVCGSADGMNPLRPLGGAFCQYASAKGDLILKIPDFMSMEEAAPSGTALGSAGLSLFVSLQVPASLTNPTKESIYVLINGGATSTGTMSIQFAK
jgi:NADPH:quinone reductase-like Zn-dependent oxidoreductase